MFLVGQNTLEQGPNRSSPIASIASVDLPVSFHSVLDFPGLDSKASAWFSTLIKEYSLKDVLEVGAGGSPTFSAETVSDLNIRYVVNDVSSVELQKSDSIGDHWVSDLARDPIPPGMQNRFDLVFSKMVNEHVSDGRAYHTNIHGLLKPGGISAHCFPNSVCFPMLSLSW